MTELRVGVVPDESSEVLARKYEPLLEYLKATTGLECRLVISGSYADMLAGFRDGKMDIARFGGVTFVMAHHLTAARPLVMRSRDLEFTSYFIVRADDSAASLDDVAGRTCAFGDQLSTSGHLMPRHFLTAWGYDADRHFGKIIYTGGHDATAYAVRDGRADVGAINARIFDSLIAAGAVTHDEVRILRQTPTYSDYAWAAHPTLPEDMSNTIREAMLALSIVDARHRDILRSLDARLYIPASTHDFSDLTRVVSRRGLLESVR